MPRTVGLADVALFVLPMVWLALVGCGREASSGVDKASSHGQLRPSVALHVLIVNEPRLVEAMERLRGEWAERFGGDLDFSSVNWAEVATAERLEADVIVFPSRYMGELCVRGWLRPVRPHVLESEQLDTFDLFPLVRRRLIRWGGQTMALPLAVDWPLMADPSERRPLLAFLLAAAPELISNERVGEFFDLQTMKPRITDPPFVDALSRFVEGATASSEQGRGTGSPVPVLGFGDPLVAVSAWSHNAASAFKLIAWLVQADTSTQLARAFTGMLPVRRSLVTSPFWYDPALTASQRSELGKLLEAALSGERCLFVPRIPGVDEYLAALEQAVKSALNEKIPPAEALESAARSWEQITDAHGREAQRAAYLKHLGIDEP